MFEKIRTKWPAISHGALVVALLGTGVFAAKQMVTGGCCASGAALCCKPGAACCNGAHASLP